MMSVQEILIQALGLQAAGQADAAGALFRDALAIDPANAHAHYSLGLLAMNAGDLQQALQWCESGVQASPGFAPLHYLQGAVLQAAGKKDEALRSFDAALALQPDYVEVLLNSGALLRSLFRHGEALERFNRILSIDPDHTGALANSGILLSEFKQSEAAIRMFERLTTVAPDYDYGLGLLFYEQMHICDWRLFDSLTQQIVQGVRAGRRVCKSLALMSASDRAGDHLQAARIFASHHCPPAAKPLWAGEKYRHDRIRLAYVSPDFREHPVGHLMAGIFERHDHSRFETIAISLGIDDQSRLRARIRASFDHFIDASTMLPEQIAHLMRSMEVDIAVDLGGFTSDTKTALFAHRPAPVQVNYLGYPGSMGTPYHDYIIADRHVIPPDQHANYTEKVVYLPDSYLPVDNSIRIAQETPTRQACGLPEGGFVFCSFSHDYKISPPVFEVWMDLLAQVPASVLWLASRNEVARRNLRQQARDQGVDPARLVFAERLPRVEDHLARYRQADLFLDTHPYNAHTTAADALMAGLPVLTFEGSAFPSRVAASLLRSAGLPDMVTESLQAYAARALALAQAPEELAAIRARLADNQARQPLFDTAGFCRHLETVYQSIRKEAPMTRSLDLGCGRAPKNPFNADEVFGIDFGMRPDLPPNIRLADLVIDPIPFEDDSFEFVTAYDFIEHVPRVIYNPTRRNPFVELMSEVWRVLKMNGTFLSLTPAYPHSTAFIDPTHVNIIAEGTFPLYFGDQSPTSPWAVIYGFKGAFKVVSEEWRGPHLLTVLQKIPPRDNL
jgi:predicted O-linked N-acetylglucosamine transferase (SPINDLY family)